MVQNNNCCLLSPTLFNIFLKTIMTDSLEEHDGKVSTGSRTISNLWFADDIHALSEEEQSLEALVESLGKPCTPSVEDQRSNKVSG